MATPTPLAPAMLPRWPSGSRVLRSSPAMLAIGLTALVVFVLFVLTALDPARAQAWENAHWTLAAIGAAVAAALGASTTTELREQRVRRNTAFALAVWSLGQLTYDLELVLGFDGFPTLADGIFLASAVPASMAVRAAVTGLLSRTELIRLGLDAGMVFFTAAAIMTLVFGPQAMALGGAAGVLLVAFPIVFIGGAVAAFVSVLATRVSLRPPGAAAMIAGLVLLGLAHTFWSPAAADGTATIGEWPSYLFSVALLMLGIGAATWRVGLGPTVARARLRWRCTTGFRRSWSALPRWWRSSRRQTLTRMPHRTSSCTRSS